MISIIMPAYNAEKYIAKSINSILKQTFPKFELIIINDGSTDDTLKIIEFFQKKDSRIFVKTINNSGPSNARNQGILLSKHKYICFIDADDEYQQDFLKIGINHIEKYNSDFFIALFSDEFIYKKLNLVNIYYISKTTAPDFMQLIKGGVLNAPTVKIYKKSILKCNNIFFDTTLNIGEDFNFNILYLSKISKFIFYNKSLYKYNHGNPQSLTKQYKTNYLEKRKKNLSLIKNFLGNDVMVDEFLNENKVRLLYSLCFNYFAQKNKQNYDELKEFLSDDFFKEIQVKDWRYKFMYILYKYNSKFIFISINEFIYFLRKKGILKTIGTSI